ncbi:MAG: OsmC family protein [Gammaproteobacteria bacterium]|nr:OsmC family protein [Gammaproteobacteria bacterium]
MPTAHAIVIQQDHSSSAGEARGHRLVMDRPEAKGGQDKGPMGGEAVLMGLGGCFMSNLLAAAAARNISLKNARAEIEGDIADAPPRYTAIRMRVSADCGPASELAKLVVIAERGCIAANTLRNAVALSVECAT